MRRNTVRPIAPIAISAIGHHGNHRLELARPDVMIQHPTDATELKPIPIRSTEPV